MDETIVKGLIETVKLYNPSSDSEKIKEAYDLAYAAHKDQTRDSGEEYIIHPLCVAQILADLQLDDTAIIAGILHDVVEDTDITLEQLEEMFGKETVILVDGVTKLGKLQFKTKQERQAGNLRKMLMAMSNDIRIILIKLADRLHNIRTLSYHHSQIRQKEIAEETLSIFAPLAHRLGIFTIKSELEELSFSFVEPEAYADLKRRMTIEYNQRDSYISEICETIKQDMQKMQINGDIQGRFKNLYSIYKKMHRQQKDLNEIFDLCAIRIIVDNIKNCYGVLGLVHTRWKPIPGRFKDYLAMPKQNMYQSIHTTVIGDDGNPFEVQIRTYEMHRTAEYGIAAHWRYKEGKSAAANFDKKVEWLRQMLDWQQDLRDAHEFMESVKMDLFTSNIYVFSPKGDVYELPYGSCPIDFAYRVHTEIGHQCLGAKVNRRLVPLDHQLKNGDIVEIMTAKGRGPNLDWLKIVKTQQAKNKIRQWLRKESRDDNIFSGRESLEKEFEKNHYDFLSIIKNDKFADVIKRFNLTNLDDLFAAIGYGALNISTVLSRIREEFHLEKEPPAPPALPKAKRADSKPGNGIWVKGSDNILVRFAHCCNPLPGDEIVGYVTRGKGVSAHRKDCPNINYYGQHEPDRLIEIGWEENVDGIFQVEIEIISEEREKLTMDIMSVMTETKTTVNGINITTNKKNKIATAVLKIEVKTLLQLDYILKRLTNTRGILEVKRI